MKIAITGHTRGIGKAIADLFQPDEILGFSRSNGYDISVSGSIDSIVTDSIHCDVFVNNAYHDLQQVVLFEKMYHSWKDHSSKTIVNVNSRAKYDNHRDRPYSVFKKELHSAAVKAMSDHERKCRIINVNPGYVKTQRVEHLHNKYNMLEPSEVAKIIKWCLDQPQGVEIGEISVWSTTL
jgi:NADP-dependent 3-hydroxy acid dehydrogenase YdfG